MEGAVLRAATPKATFGISAHTIRGSIIEANAIILTTIILPLRLVQVIHIGIVEILVTQAVSKCFVQHRSVLFHGHAVG